MRLLIGPCVVDTQALRVTRDGAPVAIEPKVFDLLLLLIENRARVVSRDEILEKVWAGRIVSDDALSSCIKAARRAVGDDGKSQQVIRTIHRRGFQLVGPVMEQGKTIEPDPAPPERSIAVLPFQNMSGDPEQEYFSDGLVEDIITALSRFRSLFVIARNSSFGYKGRTVDVRQVGRELGVRYVLEGSVRKAGRRLRITGQLIDCATGAHIWADRYDGNAADVFDLQDRVTLDVVGAITPKLEQADIARVAHKPTGHIGAYDCYLRGVAAYHSAGEEGLKKAQAFCSQAIELDPGFAAPYAIAAFCQALQHGIGVRPTEVELALATRRSRRAVELDRDDAVILSMATWVEAHLTRDLDAAADLAERAIAINPNLAFAWAASGWVHVWMGKPGIGLKHLLQARRLSPLDVNQRFVLTGIAQAHFMLEQYDKAFAIAVRALQNWRQAPTYRVAAASAALSGRLVEARKFVAGLLEVDPGRRLATLEETLGAYRRAEDIKHLKRGLQLAGLPQ